ncbi:unnamed protein product [Anisakis simplex]|uniref:MOR2-PAG1_C domain-containing protein n=1 Tax=Anisakis simplex TaxID=6269 RepID=A0A0M3JWW6_ANISI|nr:unnamed protein product [Anisakis simplex]
MLERCTVTLHMYVLHSIYLLLCHGDLSNSSPIPFNAQVIRVVSRHLQGPNWKEAARILKCVVQFNNIALNGITQEDGNKSDANGMIASSKCSKTKTLQVEVALDDCVVPLSPRKSIFDSCSMRRHNLSQAKVRERLISLLNASGLRVGLPKSASVINFVIFSQSSYDITHEQPGGSISSSTEKIALSHGGDIDTASSLVADHSVTDSFPRVFREFDFLEAEHDSVSESTESCFNWLSTMRPHSISNVEEQYQDDECTETNTAQRRSSADSFEVSSERTPLQSETRSETTEEEEEEESCDEEIEEEEFIVEEEQQRVADVSSLAESIQCSRSEVSDECLSQPQSTTQLPLFLECNHHSSAQSEQQWLSTFVEMSKDEKGELTAHATLLFSQLYRVSYRLE